MNTFDTIEPPNNGPLSGIIIADFSRVLAGPYATMILGDLGATVIKVESPAGDDTRTWKPPAFENDSTYFLSINRNKYSYKLDLRIEKDLERAKSLTANCDIFIENFKPKNLQKYQLDYESVRELNESIIYASISGFGERQGSHLPGYDLVAQGVSGLMSVTGPADSAPYKTGVAIVDVLTGLNLATGVLAALYERTKTNKGQRIEVNLLNSALSGLVNQSGAYAAAGVIPQRMGNSHPSLMPYEPFRTSDGEIIIAVGNDSQFRQLCQVLKVPHLADDERFVRNEDRVHNRIALKNILEALLKDHTKSRCFEILTDAGVPCGPINSISEGVTLAQELGLAPIVRQIRNDGSTVSTIANPISLSRTPVQYRKPPPGLGDDNELINTWLTSLGNNAHQP